jgi:hypothetical protein
MNEGALGWYSVYGQVLIRAGVRFHDLTMVFKNVREAVYSDGCCHLNAAGYAMVASVIGESIHADVATGEGTHAAR